MASYIPRFTRCTRRIRGRSHLSQANEDAPYYERDGRIYARTTRVLDIIRNPGLEDWRARIGDAEADKVSRKATRLGKACHKAIAATLAGTKVTPPKGEAARAWQTWQAWYAAQQDFRPSRWEQTLFSDEYGHAGTPDCIEDGAISGINRISDWKMATSISPIYTIQLHAYVPLAWPNWRQMTDIKLRLVRIDPFLGICEQRDVPFNPRIVETFLKLLDVYRDWYLTPFIERSAKEAAQYAADV